MKVASSNRAPDSTRWQRHRAWRTLGLVLAAGALAPMGCGGGDHSAPPRTATPTSLPTVAPTPSPTVVRTPPQMGECPDYVPDGCTELAPGATLPQPVQGCFKIVMAGTYTYDDVNILAGGGLYFVEDPTGTIDFRVHSLLVEQ